MESEKAGGVGWATVTADAMGMMSLERDPSGRWLEQASQGGSQAETAVALRSGQALPWEEAWQTGTERRHVVGEHTPSTISIWAPLRARHVGRKASTLVPGLT